MNNLDGKIIVVTGGNGLLGAAIIKDIRQKGGTALSADVNPSGSELEYAFDVTSEASITALITSVTEKYGRIDGWVNCAYPRTKDWGAKFEHIPAASWKENVDLQMNSVFSCCQQVSAQMKKQGGGSIINIASIYGIVGPDFSVYEGSEMTMPAAYAAIKGGVINFTKYLASYLGPEGIRVNCVSPGGIFDSQNEAFVKRYEAKTPLRRMASPADVAPSISFLLSDDASYITGHNLVVDGGWTAI